MARRAKNEDRDRGYRVKPIKFRIFPLTESQNDA